VFDLALAPVGERFDVVIDLKDHDQVRRDLKELFMPVSAERRQSLQPFIGEAPAVILTLLLFGGQSDPAFDFGIADYYEAPGLLVRARRGDARGAGSGENSRTVRRRLISS
jgi:hypothetical protein